LSKALANIFPDIKFQRSRFVSQQTNEVVSEIRYYSEEENRRKFFESYAAINRFDVLDVRSWQVQSREKLLSLKGVNRIIAHHGSIPKALFDLFPQMKSNRSMFSFALQRKGKREMEGERARGRDRKRGRGREWMDSVRERGVREVKKLLYLYHNINYVDSLETEEGRRDFFERFAKKNGFDPLVPENWYSQQKEQIKSFKGAQKVLQYHSRSIEKALCELFPKIELERSRFNWK